ncbi:MAG: hypothetical protein N4A72_14665 [Bacteroidales bacterium]|jgi:hypothetical protein|nr:hypothetical protein [Bacteroidales bacterium]
MGRIDIIVLGLNRSVVTDKVTAEQAARSVAEEMNFNMSDKELKEAVKRYQSDKPKKSHTDDNSQQKEIH